MGVFITNLLLVLTSKQKADNQGRIKNQERGSREADRHAPLSNVQSRPQWPQFRIDEGIAAATFVLRRPAVALARRPRCGRAMESIARRRAGSEIRAAARPTAASFRQHSSGTRPRHLRHQKGREEGHAMDLHRPPAENTVLLSFVRLPFLRSTGVRFVIVVHVSEFRRFTSLRTNTSNLNRISVATCESPGNREKVSLFRTAARHLSTGKHRQQLQYLNVLACISHCIIW